MCGIAGIVNLSGSQFNTAVAIRHMTDRMAHRGPDDEGILVNEHIALGHRRLSIIDLSEAGRQPMWDSARRYVIVFNGEIYNYRELKKALPDYPYYTHSDTEVILAYFSIYGKDCLQYFNGMFAFAIWDALENTLFMARDRLGKKPFYYYRDNEKFIFSSEVRSIISSGLITPQLEPDHLAEFLQYQAAIGPHTMVRGIQRLHAGCYATLHKGRFVQNEFWAYKNIEAVKNTPESARKEVHRLLMDAVRLRMVSDVPVGAFLSGGIDSSIMVACMASQSERPVDTFTIGFREKDYDESPYASQIAQKFQTHHHHIQIAPEVFLDSLDEIFDSMDTPSGDGPNTFLVSKYTREAGIKVAITGLGGDELFAGYDKFMMYHRLMKHRHLLRWPSILRRIFASTVLAFRIDARTAKLMELAVMKNWNWESVYPVLRRAYSHKEVSGILNQKITDDYVEKHLSDISSGLNKFGELSMSTIGEFETYTRDVLLRDTDQMSMRHGLEVRVPFFDYRLVEYLISLPDEVKYPHTPKQLLTSSFQDWLPAEIIQRKKMGFTLPIEKWLRTTLADFTEQKLNYLAARPEFNAKVVLGKWSQFRKGDPAVLWTRIWKLLVLGDWLERNGL